MKLRSARFNQKTILLIISVLLILLSLAYFTKGFYNLTVSTKDAGDLFERWKEQQYIYQGQYPYDVKKGSPYIDPKIGAISSGGYPPWAFFIGFIFLPGISWELTRLYYALLNIISILILAIFAYRIGYPYGKLKALFSMSASLAISSHVTTLNNGQYGIIINALLIGMFWSLQKHKYIWAGLFLGMAMVKPNVSGFYFFILIARKRVNAALAFFLYIISASITVWIITKVDPIYMVNSLITQSKYFADKGYSGVNILSDLGIDPKNATVLLALIGMVLIGVIFYLCRNYSLLTLFATASVIGRILIYHRIYDNVMLIFLLLALIRITLSNPQRANILMLTVVAVSLWLPANAIQSDFMRMAQFIIWTTGLGYILMQEKHQLKLVKLRY